MFWFGTFPWCHENDSFWNYGPVSEILFQIFGSKLKNCRFPHFCLLGIFWWKSGRAHLTAFDRLLTKLVKSIAETLKVAPWASDGFWRMREWSSRGYTPSADGRRPDPHTSPEWSFERLFAYAYNEVLRGTPPVWYSLQVLIVAPPL